MIRPICLNRKGIDSPIKDRQLAFVERFARGCDGILMSYQEANQYPIEHPWVIRGMKFTGAIDTCWKTNRVFYYIDNGYFGNVSQKIYFRIIKNHVHDIRPVIDRPADRLNRCSIVLKKYSTGRKILLAPPSEKSLSLWGMNAELWAQQTIEEIKKHTDRPIEVRFKRPRSERLRENTMEQALNDDVHCLVTYNSVAAVEAVMLGKPAITLGPNAAGVVCSQSLADIERPKFPSEEERAAWLRHLSYSQFTFNEMTDGTAWRILNDKG